MIRLRIAAVAACVLFGCAKDAVVASTSDGGADTGVDAQSGDMGGDAGSNMFNFTEGFVTATYVGESTGTETSTTCSGFFPATPSAYFTLPTTFTRFRVRASSEAANEALRITFGASSFCGTVESDGAVVERGSWSAGTYEVYVGSDTDDQNVSFELIFEEPS